MAERERLLAALVSEVLGPRGGVRERLEAAPHRAGQAISPLEEYITGVLAPRDAVSEELDSSEDIVGPDDESADDALDPGAPAVPPGITPTAGPGRSPALDPRSRPCSIGLSIVVEGVDPRIEVCTTWAWYVRSGSSSWQRDPRYDLWTGLDCARARSTRDISEPDGRRVTLEVRSRPAGAAWRVSIFAVNTTAAQRPGPEHHVYQPQIRVSAGAGTRLLPLDDDAPPADDEAASLALLYSGRRALARGHLCAAMWREVDPEQSWGGPRPTAPPFFWLDGTLLPAGIVERFSPADARTELVPCYAIHAPQLAVMQRHGGGVFDPEQLSELWEPGLLRSALSPLPDAYEAWISQEQDRIQQLPAQHRAAAERHLQDCTEMLRRMREGIDVLCNDESARLAFCFANRAIAIQGQWKGSLNPWRPFQLAFQLVNVAPIRFDDSPGRLVCDLLWVPTGGGKTEAYLGLAAFTFALRRLLAREAGRPPGGVSVVSRYTLRLLTIQQFRRALSLVTACEKLRVMRVGGKMGWRPHACPDLTDGLWGSGRFSIGLWVGGNVTPNGLFDFAYQAPDGIKTVYGALSILRGQQGEGEPAQVLKCPACGAILAVPPEGFGQGRQATMHFVIACERLPAVLPGVDVLSGPRQQGSRGQAAAAPLFTVLSLQVRTHSDPRFHTLSVTFVPAVDVTPDDVDRWCNAQVLPAFGRRTRLVAARPSRPGYFFRMAPFRGGRVNDVDFELFCPDPACTLNTSDIWSEETPAGRHTGIEAFELRPGEYSRIPIPALTVDEQLYNHCPTVVVATVDKFARLAFEPRASSLFGVVDHFCDRHGYYRAGAPPIRSLPPRPVDHPPGVTPIPVQPFDGPDLILQDELHLIEGPLGSMVGIYETAVESLASRVRGKHCRRPKYIASSATGRQAADQVQSLYDRRLAQFPPPGTSVDDNFFTLTRESHALESSAAGRLYVGICAPGRGAQTPIVRIWSRLLQHAEARRQEGIPALELDPFWTLVGYFNAIRELAGVVALARQDIPERISFISPAPRQFPEDEPMELSSRASSLRLPGMLERLGVRLVDGNPVGMVVSTSMFGTGVDVPRLGLMVVHGQPKSSSAYIQATGRVGRERGGLVVTFYRASRPRDLSHYEFFVGYHRELYRHVEPVTVNPFSPRARDRALGPVGVAHLRQALALPAGDGGVPVSSPWHIQQRYSGGWRCSAGDMATRRNAAEVNALPVLLEARAIIQPAARRPEPGVVSLELNSELDRWAQLSGVAGQSLLYHEPSVVYAPSSMVVLGDLAHEALGLPVAYENAPTSSSRSGIDDNDQGQVTVSHQQVRPSQFITTYGPGSILETTSGPVVISSFERIFTDNGLPLQDYEIRDSRLSRDPALGGAGILRVPTNAELGREQQFPLYASEALPYWSLCVDHRVLYMARNGCPDCPGRRARDAREKAGREAIRFVRACPAGHLDDVDWHYVVHDGPACGQQPGSYLWRGGGGSLRNVEIRCPQCGASANFGEAYGRKWRCSGRFPELGPRPAQSSCSQQAVIVQRGAANLRVSKVISALTIPPLATRLHNLLQDGRILAICSTLIGMNSLTETDFQRAIGMLQPPLAASVVDFLQRSRWDEIRAAITQVLAQAAPRPRSLKEEEFESLRYAATYGAPPVASPQTGGPSSVRGSNRRGAEVHRTGWSLSVPGGAGEPLAHGARADRLSAARSQQRSDCLGSVPVRREAVVSGGRAVRRGAVHRPRGCRAPADRGAVASLAGLVRCRRRSR